MRFATGIALASVLLSGSLTTLSRVVSGFSRTRNRSNSCSRTCLPRPAGSRTAGRTSTTTATSISSSASRTGQAQPPLSQRSAARSSMSPRAVGVADLPDTRAAAWGRFRRRRPASISTSASRADRRSPTSCIATTATARIHRRRRRPRRRRQAGETRQVSWIDFDNDGDVDLFVAFRDAPNMLFRNDGRQFAERRQGNGRRRSAAGPSARCGSTTTEDGDLDLFVANQNGDAERPVPQRRRAVRRRRRGARHGRRRASDTDGQQRSERCRLRQRRPISICSSPATGATSSIATTAAGGSPRSRKRCRGPRRRQGDAVTLGRLRQRRPSGSLCLVVRRSAGQRARLPLSQ